MKRVQLEYIYLGDCYIASIPYRIVKFDAQRNEHISGTTAFSKYDDPYFALTNVTLSYHTLVIPLASLSSSSHSRPDRGGGSTSLLHAAVEYKL